MPLSKPDPQSIAFATYEVLPDLTADDRSAAEWLRRRGGAVAAVCWDRVIDWRKYACVLLRSTWDYYQRKREFLGWLDRLEAQGIRLINPYRIVRWNIDKHYLQELESAGAPVVPTRWLQECDAKAVAETMRSEGWHSAVVKPAISAGAHQTFVCSADAPSLPERMPGRWLLQPFVEEIHHDGEWSLIYFDGDFSHAVLKRPAAGDFRVQEQYGGSAVAAQPAAAWIALGADILAKLPELPTYARLDGVVVQGNFLIMELELIEPSLFFYTDPHAVARFWRTRALAAATGIT